MSRSASEGLISGWLQSLRRFFLPLCLAGLIGACSRGLPPPTQPVVPVLPTPLTVSSPSVTPPALSTATVAMTTTTAVKCTPTIDDGLSPSYKPDAPIRSVVGHGHVLSGVVRSSRDCTPIAEAKVELWPEYADRGHPDEARATLFTNNDGRYRFECDLPEHIHMRISAPGYRTIAQNSYHPDGKAEGTFDIVLVPDSP